MRVRTTVIIFCLLALVAGPVFGQEEKELKTPKDRLSYGVGVDMANNLKKYELDIDLDLYLRGIKDGLAGKKLLLTEDEVKAIILEMQKDVTSKLQEKGRAQMEKNKIDGEAFLVENKKKEGVKELPSGLQYRVLTEGMGKSPQGTDSVVVNYRGTLIDGTEFDSSYKRGAPATFPVSGIIKGWSEALQLMKEGAKWQLFMPAGIAYAERGMPGIPPNSALIFEVELLKIEAKK